MASDANEFEGADFGDRRLSARLTRLGNSLGEAPSKSLPESSANGAELEATYRFLGNERVTAARILRPHVSCTVARAVVAKTVFVAHDTTELRFSGPREDLGFVSHEGRGFFAHVSLAVSADGHRNALGVLHLRAHDRSGISLKRGLDRRPHAAKESWRWWESVREVAGLLRGKAEAIHLMDREADSYDLISRLQTGGAASLSG